MEKINKIHKRKLFDNSLSYESMQGIENLCNDDELGDLPGALD